MWQIYFRSTFFLIKFLCHSFGLPHLEQTCLMLFQGYHVVVPLILRRRIRLCIALQEQALALWQHLRLRLKGDEQPDDWPCKQTAGGAAVWDHHQLLWVGLLHCIKEKIIKGGQNKQKYLQSEWHQCGPTGKRCSWHHGWPYKYSGPCGTRTMDTEPALVCFLPHPRSMNDFIGTINVKVLLTYKDESKTRIALMLHWPPHCLWTTDSWAQEGQ